MGTTTKKNAVVFQVVLIGDQSVGKTCLMARFTEGVYFGNSISTCGVDLAARTVTVGDNNAAVTLQIWDTAGQERFRSLAKSFLRGAQGIIVVYDITSATSFNNVQGWLDDIERHCCETELSKILVGNKCDDVDRRIVTFDEGKQFADSMGIPFLETSAKTGGNVVEAFHTLAGAIFTNQNRKYKDKKKRDSFKITDNEERLKKPCCG